METHGGYGRIWERCYGHVAKGIVFEKDPAKSFVLAKQRPGWSVYECDSLHAIQGAVGSHLPINFLDCDPYGEPWPIIEAFFSSKYQRPEVMVVAVNDGLRQKLKMNGAWSVGSMEGIVRKYGNQGLYRNYLDICRELLEEKAVKAGYAIDRFWGYYCGHADQMTHYAAFLRSSLR